MNEIQSPKQFSLGHLDSVIWKLFGIWNLEFGILKWKGANGFDRVRMGESCVLRLSGGLIKHLANNLNADNYELAMAA